MQHVPVRCRLNPQSLLHLLEVPTELALKAAARRALPISLLKAALWREQSPPAGPEVKQREKIAGRRGDAQCPPAFVVWSCMNGRKPFSKRLLNWEFLSITKFVRVVRMANMKRDGCLILFGMK